MIKEIRKDFKVAFGQKDVLIFDMGRFSDFTEYYCKQNIFQETGQQV